MSETRSKNAIVLGMPRSGTSFAAAIFARQGYYVTSDPEQDLRQGDEHNPFGYWEAGPLVEANSEVLRRVGYEHHNTWIYPAIAEEAVARIRALEPSPEHREFVQSYLPRHPWMWKDPRLCLTLSYWWKLMDPATTSVLLMKRSPESIYHSFRRVNWIQGGAEAHAEVIYKIGQHVGEAERTLREMHIPHTVVDYDRTVESPGGVAMSVGETFGLTLSDADLNVQRGLDHSKLTNRLWVSAKREVGLLPAPLRRALKRLIPSAVYRIAFPEKRFETDNGKAKPGKT